MQSVLEGKNSLNHDVFWILENPNVRALECPEGPIYRLKKNWWRGKRWFTEDGIPVKNWAKKPVLWARSSEYNKWKSGFYVVVDGRFRNLLDLSYMGNVQTTIQMTQYFVPGCDTWENVFQEIFEAATLATGSTKRIIFYDPDNQRLAEHVL